MVVDILYFDSDLTFIITLRTLNSPIAGMKTIQNLMKRKGVSPVIATVILVAVAITVSVAVAYWMSGIAGQYTSFEKVEIQSATVTYITVNATHESQWQIVVDLKNTGTKAATIISVFVNDVEAGYALAPPAPAATGITAVLDTTVAGDPLQILSGASGIVKVWIVSGEILSAGTTVNVKIHSAGGMDYPKLVQLT